MCLSLCNELIFIVNRKIELETMAALKKKYSNISRRYQNTRSDEEYSPDLDWLVITEMQFLENHLKNKPNSSALNTQRLASFSDDYQIPSRSTSSMIKSSSFPPLHNYKGCKMKRYGSFNSRCQRRQAFGLCLGMIRKSVILSKLY